MKKTLIVLAGLIAGFTQGTAMAASCSYASASGWHWAGKAAATSVAISKLPAGYSYVSGSANCSSTATGAPVTCSVKGSKCPTIVSRTASARSSANIACQAAQSNLISSYSNVSSVYFSDSYNSNTGYFHCTAYGQI